MKTQSIARRYLGIALCIIVFISSISVILLLNINLATSLQQDTQALVVISRQQAQLESLIKYSYNINRLAHLEQNYSIDVDLLHSAFRQFDETLEAMIYGAASTGSDQRVNQLLTDKAFLNAHQGALAEINKTWQQYRSKLSPLANAYFSGFEREQVIEKSREAIAASDSFHLNLESNLLNLSAITDEQAASKLQKIRRIQLAGIVISLLSLFAITSLFFSQVRRTDQQLARKQAENKEILSAVSDGLLLIDKQLIIGEQTSSSLQRLLPATNYSGQRFSELLKKYVSPETLKTTEDYIDILFSKHVEESLVQSLNPLQETLFIIDNNGERIEQYIDINFVRTWNDGQISHVLVSLRDVSANVKLKQQLQQSKQQTHSEQSVLMALLQQDTQEVRECLQRAEKSLHDINQLLKQPNQSKSQLITLAATCMQNTHRTKGEFATLQLDALFDHCQQLEEHFSDISKRAAVNGEDFVTAVMYLEQLLAAIESHHSVIDALRHYRLGDNSPKPTGQSWESNTEAYLNKMAENLQKMIKLHWQTQLLHSLPAELARDIKTVITQTLRNAVYHGIETIDERKRLQKPSAGNIAIQLAQQKNTVQLTITDDGKGFDLAAVKQKLVMLGEQDANHYSDQQLLAALFRHAVSTAETSSADAGQGAGLALVASLLGKHQGRVNVRRNHQGLTVFHYEFPITQRTAVAPMPQEVFA